MTVTAGTMCATSQGGPLNGKRSGAAREFMRRTSVRAQVPQRRDTESVQWTLSLPLACSPSPQCWWHMLWKSGIGASFWHSPDRAPWGLYMDSCKALGHLAWSKRFGRWLQCAAGGERDIDPGAWADFSKISAYESLLDRRGDRRATRCKGALAESVSISGQPGTSPASQRCTASDSTRAIARRSTILARMSAR